MIDKNKESNYLIPDLEKSYYLSSLKINLNFNLHNSIIDIFIN